MTKNDKKWQENDEKVKIRHKKWRKSKNKTKKNTEKNDKKMMKKINTQKLTAKPTCVYQMCSN